MSRFEIGFLLTLCGESLLGLYCFLPMGKKTLVIYGVILVLLFFLSLIVSYQFCDEKKTGHLIFSNKYLLGQFLFFFVFIIIVFIVKL